MTNEEREAIEMYRNLQISDDVEFENARNTILSLIKEQQIYIKKYNDTTEEMNRDIRKLISEIQKKDKQIDLMAEYIDEIDVSEDICEEKTMCDENCKDCVKQYFADKAKIE